MAKVKVDINEYANSQPSQVRAWISKIDKIMIENGCHVASSIVSNRKRTDGKFTYTSKRTKKSVCIFNFGTSGNFISLRGNILYTLTEKKVYWPNYPKMYLVSL